MHHGDPVGQLAKPFATSVADSNTKILSINKGDRSQMPTSDTVGKVAGIGQFGR